MVLLTVKEMQDRVAKMTYRTGWKLIVREGTFEGAHLEIIALLDDSIELGKKTEFRVNSRIPRLLSIEQFDLIILDRLLIIESHECREWLKVDGISLFYPHCEYADRDELKYYYKYQKESFNNSSNKP